MPLSMLAVACNSANPETKKKKTGRGSTRRQQRPSRVAVSDAGVAAMEVGVQSNIKKRFLVGRGNWLGSV